MTLDKKNSALVIVGHGSTLNPDSSAPTHQHADEIRRRGIFREVVCAFWKEEPSMGEVLQMLESRDVYVVPNFISEGYFCQQVIPRELRLSGPTTPVGGRTVHYCDPVGIHPNMTRLLLQRADEVAPGIPRAETGLVIAGHGTSLNENSAKAIREQVRLIREGNHGFAEVADAYMEEAPFVADWHQLTTARHVVVVPFFIADGLHSYQDIPVMLGIESEPGSAASEREVFRHNPHDLRGRRLYYSNAIGTEPLLADVILDQVIEFDRKHAPPSAEAPALPSTAAALEEWLATGSRVLGQVLITRLAAGGFDLRHKSDAHIAAESLVTCDHALAAREIVKYDAQSAFRPLKSAPTLRDGWRLQLRRIEDVVLALDIFHPAALSLAAAHQRGELAPVPLRETLGRQTGMYRFANRITDSEALAMVARKCDSASACMRRILWPLTAGQPLSGDAAAKCAPPEALHEIPLLCLEACNHLVAAARAIAKASAEQASKEAGAE